MEMKLFTEVTCSARSVLRSRMCCACVHTFISTIHLYVNILCRYVGMYVYICVCVCMHIFIHKHMHACMDTCIHTCTHTYTYHHSYTTKLNPAQASRQVRQNSITHVSLQGAGYVFVCVHACMLNACGSMYSCIYTHVNKTLAYAQVCIYQHAQIKGETCT